MHRHLDREKRKHKNTGDSESIETLFFSLMCTAPGVKHRSPPKHGQERLVLCSAISWHHG